MGDFDLTSILILAVVAAFIFLRLRSVLGTRTGFEEKPGRDPFNEDQDKRSEGEAESKDDNSVIAMPDRNRQAKAEPGPADAAMSQGDSGGPIDHALTQIALTDSAFDKEEFLVGARTAFEMIITAFAKGDQKALRPLLARDVFEDFSGAIKEREANQETLETTFVGVRSAEITDAEMRERTASVTVTFVSEQINVLKNSDGRILDGDPNAVSTITDVWTFARNTKSRDPNWTLVATDSDG